MSELLPEKEQNNETKGSWRFRSSVPLFSWE